MKTPLHIVDQNTLKAIFDSYYKPLAIFANGFVPLLGECEDIVQDTMITLWKTKAEFPNETALRSYLYKTVKNKCLNNLKHAKVKQRFVDENQGAFSTEAFAETQELQSETARVLHNALQHLTERRREVVLMTMNGAANTEIAERLDIKLQTVKNLKAKAYQELRKHIMALKS